MQKKGLDNKSADALSRVGQYFAVQSVSSVQPLWIQEILNSYAVDFQAQQVLQELAITSPNEHGFELVGGLIKHNGRIWIGANSALQTKIISTFHCSAIGGHSGVQATFKRVHKLFTWPQLRTSVQEFVQQCVVCQQAKHELCRPPGLLQPLPIPQGAWQDISLDFIDGLPLSASKNVILVVVDHFTKFAHFIPLKHPYTAQQVALLFLERIVALYGLPKTIVSDQDAVFTSQFWKQLFTKMKVPLNMSTSYHPQTDGQPERVNQCLEMYLRCATTASPSQWCSWLPLAQYWYNTTYHSALHCTPYKALFGQDPRYAFLPELCSNSDPPDEAGVQTLLQDRQLFSEMLQYQLSRAQNRMKQYADEKRFFREFALGDKVFLKLQPYA